MSADTLQQAYRLIREGKKPEAVRLLVPLVRAEPRNADAWWLLANGLEDPDKQRRAVERVLLLRPDDARAQKLLDRLQPPLDDPFADIDFDQVDTSTPLSELVSAPEPVAADDDFPPDADLVDAPVSAAETPDADDEFPSDADLVDAPVSAAETPDADDEFPPDADLVDAPVGVAETPDADDEFPPDESFESIDAGTPLAASIRTAEHEFPPVDAYEPYDEVPVEARRVRVHRSRRGSSPITLVLAAIGLITVLSCGLCCVASFAAVPAIRQVVGDVIQTVTFEPGFSDIMQTITYEPGFATLASLATAVPGASTALNDPLPADLNRRGNINVGQTLRASVNTFKDDAWTFNGEANQKVIIELNATDDTLDPQLYVYDPDNREIAANDDADPPNDKNSYLAITLPYSGAYTIRVSAFGTGGFYDLIVRAG